MLSRKFVNITISMLVLVSLLFSGTVQVSAREGMNSVMGSTNAAPASATDETKVPHYFGPNPNWALSPLRVSNVEVMLEGGGGTGATATATVDPISGAILSIDVTNPGSNYTSAPIVKITSPINTIGGPGTNASATAVVDYSGVVTGVTVNPGGAGYTAPTATIDGGGAVSQAAGTVYGGVDAVAIVNGGLGYTFPTVEFGPPDGPNGAQAQGHATMDANGGITAVVVDNPGSGYSVAPVVTIHNGTAQDPIAGATLATANSALTIQSVVLTSFGTGYTSAPTVTINDPTGTGAVATATVSISGTGVVTSITVDQAGSGYMTPGIKKFVDQLPGLCNPADPDTTKRCQATGKYIPLAVPENKNYNGVDADEYVIGLVQYRTSFSSSLPDTLVRGYVQLETAANAGISQHFPLTNDVNGAQVPVKKSDGTQWLAVTPPQWLGPTIIAAKDKPVRIVFYNLLPTGSDGDLFLPTDSSLMGSGMVPMDMGAPIDQNSVTDEVRNPMCSEYPKGANCFKDDRATLHLHGGTTPWISDGTAHQWITPAGEGTMWPEGVSVSNVPDMNVCNGKTDGCQTFYYTNQQSARLLFYHDHSWGITRLNVYAGEAAGYLITDPTEQKLFGAGGPYADLGEGMPLIVQDRTFVPEDWQLKNVINQDGSVKTYGQDPTWDQSRWGSYGDFWYHHVYMPAQNPGDPSGMSAYGRWMYGPWFWPPATPPYGPIPNPYYNMDPKTNYTTPLAKPCDLNDPTTYQYNTDPFCEPAQIPGTPNISVGMEQFNDTPIVNGVAYPTITLDPKTYRFRMLNAANDRFFNFQWYVADPSTGTDSEVAFNAAELAAAQLDPNVFPTPDTNKSPAGPEFIQIGTEGGFLPAPVVVPNQPITWITDPTRFDVGNVDQHALLLAPAERADVIVDFSKYAGKTLILYNDAPAAFPARVSTYDYYTGAPDLSPNGAPSITPGYGPNTRTVMQVKIAAAAPASQFDFGALAARFAHQSDGSGVFEEGQHPIIVGQAAYNSAYSTNFSAASDCNSPGSSPNTCDGFVRVNDHAIFGFNTLLGQNTKMTLPVQPKALHDEMNSTAFDEFGRMTANLGVEAQPPTPGAQNVTLYPFVNPATEIIDATNLPKGDLNVTPISDAADGTQVWRITHNGVDTHPIHFHLYDVQVVNRVTWDNIIIPPDPTELGWKDTVRISPLEDTIVALRPIIPTLPFEIPNAIRPLNPMMPIGSTAMFNNVDPQGNPTDPIINQLVNFGWEYVYHCHILSHEEMDMMRPVSVVLPPNAPTLPDAPTPPYTISGTGNNARVVLSWNDNSITETAFVIQSKDWQGNWTDVGTILTPLDQMSANGPGPRTYTLPYAYNPNVSYVYRVVAQNTVGYGAGFPTMTAKSMTGEIKVGTGPLAPTNLTGVLKTGPQVNLTFTDNALNESVFLLERAETPQGGSQSAWVQIATLGPRNNTGNVSFTDTTIRPATMPIVYSYRVKAVNSIGESIWSNTASVTVPVAVPPTAPSNLSATLVAGPKITVNFKDTATNETNFFVERSNDNGATYTLVATLPPLSGTGTVTYTDTIVTSASNVTYIYRVRAGNVFYSSYTNGASVTVPGLPVVPTNLTVVNGPNGNKSRSVILNWSDNSNNETGFTIQRATNSLFTQGLTTTTVTTNVRTLTVTGLGVNTQYWFRIRANNGTIIYTIWVNATPLPIRTNP